jgi:heme O synthase-like polyprenyltransferase
MAGQLMRNYTRNGAKNVYLYSLLYLALLFVAVMVDSIIHW